MYSQDIYRNKDHNTKQRPSLTISTQQQQHNYDDDEQATSCFNSGQILPPDDNKNERRQQQATSDIVGSIGEEYIPDNISTNNNNNNNNSSKLHQLFGSDNNNNNSALFHNPNFHASVGNHRASGTLSPRSTAGSRSYSNISNIYYDNNNNTHTTVGNKNSAPFIPPQTAPSSSTSGDISNNSAGGSDQYLPGLEFNINPAAASSPTLGLSEADWKAIPFSTRRKLKAAVQQQQQQVDTTGNLSSPHSLSGTNIHRTSSGTGSSVPFSQRQRERTSSQPMACSGLNRSVSTTSTDSSASNSPAFQFLSRLGTNSEPNNELELGEQVGDYIIGKLIGYGGFSQVKEAHTIDSNGNKIVRAVKVVKKQAADSSQELMDRIQSEFDHEVAIWKTLVHDNILRLRLVDDTDRATFCFTDKITGGTLFDFVKHTRGNVNLRVVKKYIYQLSSALLYLHETMRVVHRDIKLENCLLEEIGNDETKLILCDFGMSDYFAKDPDDTKSSVHQQQQQVIGPADTSSLFNQYHTHQQYPFIGNQQQQQKTPAATPTSMTPTQKTPPTHSANTSTCNSQNCGSLPYACPQLLTSSVPILEPEVDIWALGVCIYALYMGHLPWNHTFLPKLRNMILQGSWDQTMFAEKVNTDASDLVSGCLTIDPQKRFKIRQVIDHEHLTNVMT